MGSAPCAVRAPVAAAGQTLNVAWRRRFSAAQRAGRRMPGGATRIDVPGIPFSHADLRFFIFVDDIYDFFNRNRRRPASLCRHIIGSERQRSTAWR